MASRREQIGIIQELSKEERARQPTAKDWLAEQDRQVEIPNQPPEEPDQTVVNRREQPPT